MNARKIVGKRIARVQQTRVWTRGEWVVALDWIELENGDRIVAHTVETEGEYLVELAAVRPRRGGPE